MSTDFPGVNATKLRGYIINPTAPTDQQILIFDDGTGNWVAQDFPDILITDVFVVASEVEQLALTVQKGDVAIRTDQSKSYVNKTGNNTAMSDWAELLFARYTDAEAVAAMGSKVNGNPLNHDRPIQATESVVGILEIATQPEADAGTDDTKAITPKKLAAYPISIQDRLSFRLFPTTNGQIDILGWNIITDSAYALSNAAPLTVSEPGYHSHIMINASLVVGAPFNLTITGRSVDESTGVETPGDTEVISITANGWYQSAKSWIDAVTLSVPAGKTLTVDVYRNTYWDRGNKDFTLKGSRLEWTPDVATWSIQIEVLKVNNDGSISTIDSTTFANTDAIPRAANGKPGKYKRGNYNTLINGTQEEGIILRMTQTNIESFYVEVKYDE